MTDQPIDPEQLYNSDYREGFGEGKSWEDLGNDLRRCMEEIARQKAIRDPLKSLTPAEFDREVRESQADMLRLSGAFEQIGNDSRRLDEDLAAAKEKHESDSERLNEGFRELHREWSIAERKSMVIKSMKEQK